MDFPFSHNEFQAKVLKDEEKNSLEIDNYVQLFCGCVMKVIEKPIDPEKSLRIVLRGESCDGMIGGVYRIDDFSMIRISQADGIVAELEGER